MPERYEKASVSETLPFHPTAEKTSVEGSSLSLFLFARFGRFAVHLICVLGLRRRVCEFAPTRMASTALLPICRFEIGQQ